MSKKWIFTALVIVITIVSVWTVFAEERDETAELFVESDLMDKTLRYTSNRYTQPEDMSELIQKDHSLEGFSKVATNEFLELYVESTSLALKIKDKRTGYIWDSSVAADEDYNLNDTWMNTANSALTISYLNQKGDEKTESILTNESKTEVSEIENGFRSSVHFSEADITVQMEVSLEEDSLLIHIPEDGIVESEGKLVTLRTYPFLGAVHKDEIPGYMFIPDGSGALIRFQQDHVNIRAPFQAQVYGDDLGFSRKSSSEERRALPVENISIPVYGVVHGVQQNALFTEIEEGQNFAKIIAYPAGASTDFNWLTAEYHYRYRYFQPTSQSMEGYNTFQEERNEFDITKKITLLANEEADYVGMAKTYQNDLLAKGQLQQKDDRVGLRLEFLGAEVKKGLLFHSVHPMTTTTDLLDIVHQLRANDIKDMHIVYRGWTKGGLTGNLPQRFPLEKKLGSKNDFEQIEHYFAEENIPFYYYTDYLKAYDGAKGFSGRSDVARRINSQTISGSVNDTSHYYLNPMHSLNIATKDLEQYKQHGMMNLAIDSIGYEAFSDFSRNALTKSEVIEIYQELTDMLQQELEAVSLYKPNDYMWDLTDRYLDIPMYSSNYGFVSDTVPFIQMVLKGIIPYYAEFSNFHSNAQDDLLRMIEYGAYPSFYLTKEPSHLLTSTPSKDLYTSQYEDWEPTIIKQYEAIKESLGQVENETIEDRIVHDVGLVEVVYSNAKSVIVNYTNETVNIHDQLVEPKGFIVIDRGSQS